ncbi:hypothetical protein ACFVT1_06510 [Streptomyces sp. NPDC057963]|uniref:hypothetical protein n=1 Tax=Streptomyces sp. NPDC057963 TaxID=3346290 RepID=UPI0036E74DC2
MARRTAALDTTPGTADGLPRPPDRWVGCRGHRTAGWAAATTAVPAAAAALALRGPGAVADG